MAEFPNVKLIKLEIYIRMRYRENRTLHRKSIFRRTTNLTQTRILKSVKFIETVAQLLKSIKFIETMACTKFNSCLWMDRSSYIKVEHCIKVQFNCTSGIARDLKMGSGWVHSYPYILILFCLPPPENFPMVLCKSHGRAQPEFGAPMDMPIKCIANS